ncbi:hypothetical protein ACP70R_031921 [Stipagrostis hirtigluma subsp. patula]
MSKQIHPGPSHTTGREKENATSRLARSSSATHTASVVNTPASAPLGHASHVRTSSWASASSINTTTSNASARSTLSGSATASPGTPATARSTARTNRPCRRDKALPVAGQRRVSSSSNHLPLLQTSTSSRPAQATLAVSSPRSTTATSRQVARCADDVPRSSVANQSGGAGSTAKAAASLPRDLNLGSGGRGVAWGSNGAKARPAAAAAVKENGVATASAPTQRWRRWLSPAIAAARDSRRENSLANESPRNGGSRKINGEKETPHRAAAMAASRGGGLTRTGSGKSVMADAKRNEKEDFRWQGAAKNGVAPANRTLTLLQRTIRSVASRSRLGHTAETSDASSSAARGRSTSGNSQHVGAATEPDAFPSARYDAMLLREDPKNLTWLRGCDDGDDSGGGSDLVDGSLELFYV